MASKTQLVPSKNALRTLRSIALSPNTIFLGAVLSACSIASINCNIRKRLRLAEEIVETKRTIKYISKGRGALHAQRLFEAAERGDDFLLDPSRSDARRNIRNLTTVSRQNPHESKKSDASSHPTSSQSQAQRYRLNNRTKAPPSNNTIDQSRDIQTTNQPQVSNYHALNASPVSSLQSSTFKSKDIRLHKVTPSFDQTQFQDWPTYKLAAKPADHEKDKIQVKDNVRESVSQKASELARKSLDMKEQTEQSAKNQSEQSAHGQAENLLQEDNVQDALVGSWSDLDLMNQRKLKTTIHQVHVERSKDFQSGLKLWMSTMDELARNDTPQGWFMLEVIFQQLQPYFNKFTSPKCVRQLLRKLLASEINSKRIKPLLFPTTLLTCDVHPDYHGRSAFLYLVQYFRDFPDWTDQFREFQKVVKIAVECNIELSAENFEEFLNSNCSNGEVKRAEQFVNVISESFNKKPTIQTTGILIRGYAVVNDWSQVEHMLEHLHFENISRGSPNSFAAVFRPILEQYIAQHTLDRSYHYMKHAIDHWGMLPLNPVSSVLTAACIKGKRYDIIREWMKIIAELYPIVLPPAQINSISWHIAQAWKDISASCEDIEQGCAALAYASVGDPFADTFREVVGEALAEDLTRKINAVNVSFGKSIVAADLVMHYTQDLSALESRANKVLEESDCHTKLQRDCVFDLSCQLKAISRLRPFMIDRDPFGRVAVQHLSRDFGSRTAFTMPALGNQTDLAQVPEILKQNVLPPIRKLEKALFLHYESQMEVGERPNHDVLRLVVAKLSRQHRFLDAARIMDTIFESPYVRGKNGTAFDIEVYSDWLKLAWELKSLGRLERLMWAVLDSARSLYITTRFILLSKVAVRKVHTNRKRLGTDAEKEELKYLLNRLMSWQYAQKQKRWVPTKDFERLLD